MDEIVDGSAGKVSAGDQLASARPQQRIRREGGSTDLEEEAWRADVFVLTKSPFVDSGLKGKVVAVDRRRTGDALEMRVRLQLFVRRARAQVGVDFDDGCVS